jgi:hypothetical protein
MMQQVNLYQPVLRKEKKVLSARALVLAMVLVAAGLGGLSAVVGWQSGSMRSEVGSMQRQRDAMRTRVDDLDKRIPVPKPDPQLIARLDELETEAQAKRHILDALQHRSFGAGGGFADYLAGLARQRLPELWFSRVEIADGGAKVILAGSTLKPERLPQFLQRLSAEPPFQGLEFSSLSMDRPKEDARRVDFVLRTEPEEAEK